MRLRDPKSRATPRFRLTNGAPAGGSRATPGDTTGFRERRVHDELARGRTGVTLIRRADAGVP
jgi:hypothetical protein